MSLVVYNTLARKKEVFETIEPGKVRLYVCGPTVYDKAHVGHAMSALVFDIIKRYLQFKGYTVRHVMNYTDVDDKIIQRANARGIDSFELAESYIREYDQHLEELNILPASMNPRATGEMPHIIALVEDLIQKGFAYSVEGDVYYRVDRMPGYGKLSGRKLEGMQAGARIDVDERKENPMDFALWKAAKPGEPAWDSPWGKGRPGWHIECSAMSMNHLGDQLDIHGGGNDLVFPHHENEIAQTEAVTGKPFARYWIHNGMLQLSGEKMSKSTGNLVSIEDFLKAHSANVLRFMVLNSGYRNPLTFNDDVIAQAEKALDRLESALKPEMPGAKGADSNARAQLKEQLEKTRIGFETSMDDDFNSAGALGYLFDLVRAINQARAEGAKNEELLQAQDDLKVLLDIFGLHLGGESETRPADAFVDLTVEIRREIRKQKLWDLSDKIRDQLEALGVKIEDSQEGSSWHWK